jgi:hypothetical protein
MAATARSGNQITREDTSLLENLIHTYIMITASHIDPSAQRNGTKEIRLTGLQPHDLKA